MAKLVIDLNLHEAFINSPQDIHEVLTGIANEIVREDGRGIDTTHTNLVMDNGVTCGTWRFTA